MHIKCNICATVTNPGEGDQTCRVCKKDLIKNAEGAGVGDDHGDGEGQGQGQGQGEDDGDEEGEDEDAVEDGNIEDAVEEGYAAEEGKGEGARYISNLFIFIVFLNNCSVKKGSENCMSYNIRRYIYIYIYIYSCLI